MKTRLFVSLLLLFGGLLLIQSCKPGQKEPVIGLLMDQYNVERWAQDTTFFIEKVDKLGGRVICLSAIGDPDKQLEQAKKLIYQKVDVLVVLPVDLSKAAEIVKLAKEASIGVISYDRLI